jgi:Mitochondrial 39-S ribosomal protein L47 (MRP-L47)
MALSYIICQWRCDCRPESKAACYTNDILLMDYVSLTSFCISPGLPSLNFTFLPRRKRMISINRFLGIPSVKAFSATHFMVPATQSLASRTQIPSPQSRSAFHSSAHNRGLEAFFDNEKGWDWSPSLPKRRGWECAELRNKSFDDLHTIYYKSLIDLNRLYSMKQVCNYLDT